MRTFFLISLAALLGSPVVAADTDLPAKERLICKRQQSTGTRFATRICKTPAQWEAISEQHRRDMKEMIDRPQIEVRRG